MCPISVHWHVKVSYKDYWRVKMTITNYNMNRNYSDCNLVIQHPNLRSITQIFSFNYQPVIQYGNISERYMDVLGDQVLQGHAAAAGGEWQCALLHKDVEDFIFGEGWPFPRRISYNGHECVMPPPDIYRKLKMLFDMSLLFLHDVFQKILALFVGAGDGLGVTTEAE
ncbi:COBRA-like protein 7 isoform X1 [Canna indica]|uniref:COBRA-like protein 7 isoform X1 n=1 Tax=Canna indica TaxID=4628 RepID=A0AAQ3QPJ5_9LILI|nr:COBRA-like protein 7 isoform X1 [Canna indica]